MTDTPPTDPNPTDTVPGGSDPQGSPPSIGDPSPVPTTAPAGFATPAMVPADQLTATPEPEGDSPLPHGEVRHVDTSDQVDTDPEGDKPEAGHVSEVEVSPSNAATAGDLRDAGYGVDPRIPDDQVPPSYAADSPTPFGEVRPVLIPEPDQSRRLTPMQFMAQQDSAPSETPESSPSATPSSVPNTKEEGGSGSPAQTKEGGTVGTVS